MFKTAPGAQPDSYTTDIGSLLESEGAGRGADTHPHLAPRLKRE